MTAGLKRDGSVQAGSFIYKIAAVTDCGDFYFLAHIAGKWQPMKQHYFRTNTAKLSTCAVCANICSRRPLVMR